MKNKKGFTLVELLAVIVILAVIMVIAVPAVVNQMQKAKKSSFKIFGEKVLTTAMKSYQVDDISQDYDALNLSTTSGNIKGYCYTFDQIGLDSTGSYKGYVIVELSIDNKPTFHLFLTDGNYTIAGQSLDNADGLNVDDGGNNSITKVCPSICTNASSLDTCKS
jgi:type IV pilus assembly protein PilA